MKLLRSSLSISPFCASFTFLLNGKIQQYALKGQQKEKILEEMGISEDEFVKNLQLNSEETFEKISGFIRKIILPVISKDVEETSNKEIDVNELPNTLRNFLIEMKRKNAYDEGLLAWIEFAKKLKNNVDPYIREQLFNWIKYLQEEGSLAITPTGNIVGYKGVRKDFTSIHKGEGFVNEVFYENDYLDNTPGNLIQMRREKVEADPNSACSYGLHAGSWKYAKDFGEVVVLVEIDPSDVVSIPNDCNSQKLRCSQYQVIKVVDKKYGELIYK